MVRSQQSDATSTTAAMTPIPFSPFSSANSIGSEGTGTSEEPGDLGAFSTIFRALTQLHPRQPFNSLPVLQMDEAGSGAATEIDDTPAESGLQFPSSSSSLTSPSDSDGPSSGSVALFNQNGVGSTLWKQGGIDMYLTTSSRSDLEDNTEEDGPTLGMLESALVFLATERARLKSKLDEIAAPRKGKRERRMAKKKRMRDLEAAIDGDESRAETIEEASSNESLDLGDGIVSSRKKASIPDASGITPIFRQSTRSSKRGRAANKRRSDHLSPSFQSSIASVPTPESVTLKAHLTSLALRLSEQFPSDAKILTNMTFDTDRLVAGAASFNLSNRLEMEGFYEPRDVTAAGSVGKPNKSLMHVFVDHSNILVGFLEWLKKQPQQPSKLSVPGGAWTAPKINKPRLSHASLILLLERGRTCGRRVLVASSPLHQGVDDIIEMGYEVSVLQRVAIKEGLSNGPVTLNAKSRWAPVHSRNTSSASQSSFTSSAGIGNPVQQYHGNSSAAQLGSGGSSTESGGKEMKGLERHGKPSNGNGTPVVLGHRRYGSAPSTFSSGQTTSNLQHSRLFTNLLNSASHSPFDRPSLIESPSPPNGGNITPSTNARGAARYREEAVDELLQLKLLQVLVASTDKPPRGSTIVLATGDGASSQFNKDGFLGCVRQAVERGWRVELVAWEETRSRAWSELAYEIKRRRSSGEMGKGFRGGLHLVSLERWGRDLLDPSCH
ncbi:uncharacterized protein EI90DRAFT_3132398 [Cantharellus anzutake]|uniref:uncharacterized protein n=1 Tax=Cantharellus anzutake TaxID=1750568 RepID=UPI0019074D55|nr:uncharacterized protein EI90DRAFT_3132398 [Cantharellus anzutake]KAF8319862.1 hypothetical protein EI90DRAFT_3132398 [Cantharellus anzutake]